MAAASIVDELDDSDELEGSRDVYDAAEGGRAIRRRLASRKAGKAAESAENAGSQGTVPKSTGKAEAAADPVRAGRGDARQVERSRRRDEGFGRRSRRRLRGDVRPGRRDPGRQPRTRRLPRRRQRAEGTAGVAGAIASAGIPVAGVVAGIVAFGAGRPASGTNCLSALRLLGERGQQAGDRGPSPRFITYDMVLEAALDAPGGVRAPRRLHHRPDHLRERPRRRT